MSGRPLCHQRLNSSSGLHFTNAYGLPIDDSGMVYNRTPPVHCVTKWRQRVISYCRVSTAEKFGTNSSPSWVCTPRHHSIKTPCFSGGNIIERKHLKPYANASIPWSRLLLGQFGRNGTGGCLMANFYCLVSSPRSSWTKQMLGSVLGSQRYRLSSWLQQLSCQPVA
jgi:hypothetical protein